MSDERKRREFVPRSLLDLKKLGLQEPDSVRRMREAQNAIMKPYRDQRRMVRDLMEPFERTRELFEDSVGLKELQRQMNVTARFANDAMEPFRRQQKMVDSLLASFQPRSLVFNEMVLAGSLRSHEEASKLMADLARILDPITIERVTADAVTIDGEEVSFEEAEQQIQHAWEETVALPEGLRYAAAAQRLAASKSKIGILSLILMLLCFLTDKAIESPVQVLTDPVTVPIARKMLKWLQNNVNFPVVEQPGVEIRIVSVNTLVIRQQAKKNSAKLGTLRLGDVVSVVEKRTDWTFVVSVDDEDVRGWVFSRYLLKVRVPRSTQ
jgi:Bacterial SH3 domain